jgi:hypothetical protein
MQNGSRGASPLVSVSSNGPSGSGTSLFGVSPGSVVADAVVAPALSGSGSTPATGLEATPSAVADGLAVAEGGR